MNEKYIIRQEQKKDYDTIYTLVQTAFSTAKVKDGDEQDFVVRLRSGSTYIPELALVAECRQKLIAHIILSKIYISTTDRRIEALMLAPISVLLEYQNQGVGSALIEKDFTIARSMGYKAVFLCGDPAYYARFGFKPAVSFGIHNTNNIPEQYVMACELTPNALNEISGTFSFF